MKRFFQLIAVFALPAFLAACPDKDRSNDNQTTASTPLTTNCLAGQNCHSQMYGQFPGFSPYPGNYRPYGGYLNYWNSYYGHNYGGPSIRFCDCGPESRPVYHSQLGLGCVRNQVLRPIAGFMGYWQLPAANQGQWVNIPQTTDLNPTQYSGCRNHVAQACFLNQGNSCGPGMVCRSVVNNSALGICARY